MSTVLQCILKNVNKIKAGVFIMSHVSIIFKSVEMEEGDHRLVSKLLVRVYLKINHGEIIEI